ncbi:MAG: PIN domain-containing protein [Nanoarchaeota archaeon]
MENGEREMNNLCFFDTYALIELLKGSKNYIQYSNNEIITSMLNLIEFDYYCIKHNRKDRKTLYQYLKEFCIPIDDDTILKANEFKFKNKQKGISSVDSVGYWLAKKNNIKFLTGDMAFKDLPHVEFVK